MGMRKITLSAYKGKKLPEKLIDEAWKNMKLIRWKK